MNIPLSTHQQGLIYCGPDNSDTQSSTFPTLCVCDTGRWWCVFRASPAKVPNVDQQVLFTYSDDEGSTWTSPTALFTPPTVNGTPGRFRTGGLCDLGDGKIFATLAWVDYSRPEVPYFNETTEGLLDTHIFVANSEDNGDTWSDLRQVDTTPFNVPVPLTGPPLRLASGALVCQFELNKEYDDTTPWHHLSVLIISEDEGLTWSRHTIPIEDPDNQVFYWDQRVSVLPDGRLHEVFWTFDRGTSDYRTIHSTYSDDEGRTWSPLLDTQVPGQPGPVFTLSDGALAMPVVDRSAAPKITVRKSTDSGLTWPKEDTIILYDAGTGSQTDKKASMQDAWAEMYAFSVGLPDAYPLPKGGAVIAYYAGDTTDQTGIHFAVIK